MSERYGTIAVFATADALRQAAARLRDLGFHAVDAYTPYPVEGIADIVRPRRQVVLPMLMFAGAVAGAAWGYWIQYWDEAVDYPLIVGGRPYNSWPAFAVGTFEFMLLVAIFVGFIGILAASRLPQLYHPIFNAEGIVRASRDRFVLCVAARDPSYEPALVRRLFERLDAERIEEVSA